MKLRHVDEDRLFGCPMCSDQSLYIHDHHIVRCKGCNFRGIIKKHKGKDSNEKELHITIDGVMYVVEPEDDKEVRMKDLLDDEKICVVENNELICVPKKAINKKED